ncbi:MAG: hypothetical protein J5518_08530 [Lachnospiraceae bacterium]|nr:hypothetical protein [Lachnospiraceae bacterium]
MNKTFATVLKILIGIVLVGAILAGVYYGVSYRSDANKMAEELQAGNAFMEKGDYLSAIGSYSAGLEYDPENQDVKNAIAHAYVMLGSLYGSSNEAIDAYQNALLYNVENKNAYWGVANIFEERGEEDNVLSALNTGYENTGDENMKIKADNILAERERLRQEEEARLAEEAEIAAIKAAHDEVLSKVLAAFDAGDMDDVKELLRTDEVKRLADEIVSEDTSFYYGSEDTEGNRQGKGVAVYLDGYFYYGNFDRNQRSGEGTWMRAVYADSSAIGSYIFKGHWTNDLPNGSGEATSNFYKDRISSAELVKQVIKGEYKDGLENGKMSLSGTTKGAAAVQYSYTSENGVAVQSSNDDSGIKGQYIIAKSSDGKSNLTSDGSTRGVEGFIK